MTCNPSELLINPTSTSFVNNAQDVSELDSQVTAFETALDWLWSFRENRYIVFLSYNPGGGFKATYGTQTMRLNKRKFDLFFTVSCCSEQYGSEEWFNALPSDKVGFSLGNGSMEEKFQRLVDVKNSNNSKEYNSSSKSTNLKVTLDNIDITKEISLIIDETKYTLGEGITSDIVYLDNSTGKYVLDLQLVINALGMSAEDYNKASIEISYTLKN